MAGPESDPYSTGWGKVVSWIRKNNVRVTISKRRMHTQHPLIKELRNKVDITMVPLEPGQDGFFVFLGAHGWVTGDGVESLYAYTMAGPFGSWCMLPPLAIRSIKQQGEEVNHCKKASSLFTTKGRTAVTKAMPTEKGRRTSQKRPVAVFPRVSTS